MADAADLKSVEFMTHEGSIPSTRTINIKQDHPIYNDRNKYDVIGPRGLSSSEPPIIEVHKLWSCKANKRTFSYYRFLLECCLHRILDRNEYVIIDKYGCLHLTLNRKRRS